MKVKIGRGIRFDLTPWKKAKEVFAVMNERENTSRDAAETFRPRRSDAAQAWEASKEAEHRMGQASRTPNVIRAQEYLSEILPRVRQEALKELEQLEYALAVMVRYGHDMSEEELAETKANAERFCE